MDAMDAFALPWWMMLGILVIGGVIAIVTGLKQRKRENK